MIAVLLISIFLTIIGLALTPLAIIWQSANEGADSIKELIDKEK